MDEYVILAMRYTNPSDPESDIADWKVGTFEQAKYWLSKWEEEGFICHVRRCTRPINIEFVREGIDRVAMA